MGIKITQDEFIAECRQKHDGDKYDYSRTNYVNKRTKVKIICPIHGEFEQNPYKHKNGQGCPQCCTDKRNYLKQFNYKKFLDSSQKRFGCSYSFPKIEEEYENSHSKITVKCNECGTIFKKIACDFITSSNGGCQCQNDKKKLITYDNLLSQYHGDNEIIHFTGNLYITKDKVNLICREHGFYSKPIKDVISNHCKCPKCANKNNGDFKKITFSEFHEYLKGKYKTIEILNEKEYVNTSTPITFRCKVCDNVFKRKPIIFRTSNLKTPCPYCTKELLTKQKLKTNDVFQREVESIYGTRYKILSEYKSSNQKVKLHCNECNNDFEIEANSLLQGHGCPRHYNKKSIQEEELYTFIKVLFPNAEQSNRDVLNGREIDIYIPEKKIGIEYNGLYWHSEATMKDSTYHLNKTMLCADYDIKLVHIFEDEWIYKQEICKSYLKEIFGIYDCKISVNDCILKSVSKKENQKFLDENCIHSIPKNKDIVIYGLYYHNELISSMGFSDLKQNKEFKLEFYCCKNNWSVRDGYETLFQSFINDNRPQRIIYYSDIRWQEDDIIIELGFKFLKQIKPKYYYVVGNKRENCSKFSKAMLVKKYNCPIEMSARQLCLTKKLFRIYDCGEKQYEWLKNDNI